MELFSTPTCKFRGEHGLKCAVGHLINDHCYHPNFDFGDSDNFSENTYAIKGAIEASGWPVDTDSMNLYSALQLSHDHKRVDMWELDWQEIAGRFDLEVPNGNL